jgi:hypothetical protein
LLHTLKDFVATSGNQNNRSLLEKTELIHSSFISITNDSSMLNNAYFEATSDPAKLTEETE